MLTSTESNKNDMKKSNLLHRYELSRYNDGNDFRTFPNELSLTIRIIHPCLYVAELPCTSGRLCPIAKTDGTLSDTSRISSHR